MGHASSQVAPEKSKPRAKVEGLGPLCDEAITRWVKTKVVAVVLAVAVAVAV
jgi:hypothetical protein